MDEPLENLYFNWLCGKVLRLENPTPSLRYDKLLTFLHKVEFVWLVSGDDNRAEEGIALRSNFCLEAGVLMDRDWERLPCSLLEMLIAFSNRAEFATDTPRKEWFWEFIENLGLRDYSDATHLPRLRVEQNLYTFMWRQYDEYGNGGLFPLRDPKHDQREREIWYQFCDYLEDQDRMP